MASSLIIKDTMGKKSKAAKAKAKAGAGDGGGGTGGGGGGGAMVTSSKKAQKCVRCFGTVKADKGTACPGCSLLYCWRCEKKAFGECPNGSDCVHQVRRCISCSGGVTMLRVLEEKEGVNYDVGSDSFDFSTLYDACGRFQEYIEQDETLSIDANGVAKCPDCEARECYHCQVSPIPQRILSCDSCPAYRCRACSRGKLFELSMNPNFHSTAQHIMGEVARGASQSSEVVGQLGDLIRQNMVGAISVCSTCKVGSCCTTCMDDRSMESAAGALMSMSVAGLPGYQCSRCYWSTKPCTNPTCPNEVGVPTKRCGGCHLDRYCSVECQAAAYPAHVNRCNKIQEKRVAFAAAAAATAQVEKEGQGGD